MQSVTVTRANWPALAEQNGVSLELLAVLTSLSYSAVYRYKTGSRTAPDAWLAKVQFDPRPAGTPGEASS